MLQNYSYLGYEQIVQSLVEDLVIKHTRAAEARKLEPRKRPAGLRSRATDVEAIREPYAVTRATPVARERDSSDQNLVSF